MDFRADLHCHTNCSDGSLSPEELIFSAKEKGLCGISITDHDTIEAYKTAIDAAQKAGIWIGSGVEFSSVDQGTSVHVLGYDFDLENKELHEFCQIHMLRRRDRNQRILEKLEKKGMTLNLEEIESKNTAIKVPIGRPHIAMSLIEKGYVKSIQEAFNQYLGDGKSCFDPGTPMSTDLTLETIHRAGGKAFIAHPHLMGSGNHVLKLLKKPFDGIECYYAKCPPDQERKWLRMAKEKNLLISGGSDFHGNIKPGIPLGCSWVNEESFMKIFEKQKWK